MSDEVEKIKALKRRLSEMRDDSSKAILSDLARSKKIQTKKLVLKNRKVLKGHFAKVYAICWSAQKKLVSASQDGKMIIWDAYTTNKIMAVPLKSSWVMTCAFSPNEKMLASGGLDNTCSIFNIDSANQPNGKVSVKELFGHEGYISCLKFYDENQLISSSGDSTCTLWDIETKKAVRTFTDHKKDVMSISIKKTDRVFASGSCDNTAKIFDIRSNERAAITFVGHESDINSVSFLSDIPCLATGSDDSSCKLFDMRAKRQINRYVNDNILCGITSVVSSQGGKYLFAGYDDYSLYAWDVLTGEPAMKTTAHENRVSCIDINRDGLALATGSWDTYVKIWA